MIKFHTNPYILPLKWALSEPGCPVQQPRDLVREKVFFIALQAVVSFSRVAKEVKNHHFQWMASAFHSSSGAMRSKFSLRTR